MEGEPKRHKMVLMASHESGADEWYCPVCGRRFLMAWPPDYHRTILDAGDETAVHCGSSGELEIQAAHLRQDGEDSSLEDPYSDDPYLAPWREWLDQVDFDSWWQPDN
jgi:hypothetical protein